MHIWRHQLHGEWSTSVDMASMVQDWHLTSPICFAFAWSTNITSCGVAENTQVQQPFNTYVRNVHVHSTAERLVKCSSSIHTQTARWTMGKSPQGKADKIRNRLLTIFSSDLVILGLSVSFPIDTSQEHKGYFITSGQWTSHAPNRYSVNIPKPAQFR